ncbi:Lethal(2) giant larvae protein-like protein SRO7, partial [Bienertia sinuspersici]
SKSKSSLSCLKKQPPSNALTKEKVIVDYYNVNFNGDAEFKEIYERLFKHVFTATRYCGVATLKALHIEDDVPWLFSNVGWCNFHITKYPTYKRVTLEFLSSLKANVGPGFDDGMITFCLYNASHSRTLAQLNEVLGLPSGDNRSTSKYWNASPLWRILTGKEFDSKKSSSSHIRHPAHRYVHKALANTVFSREENSKVRKDEVCMLDHMLHVKAINTGAFLIWQMESIVANQTAKGAIVLEGLITPIALNLGHKERLLQDGLVRGPLL